MLKLVTVVGARPQFVKAAALGAAIRERHRELLVHTGQHYDRSMSDVFFEELGIPAPDVDLGIGSGPHGEQTGRMLAEIEKVLVAERPDAVVVYGDTNSTLAGALAAAKLEIPVAHVEAGLRSFNRSMPEEVNRVLTDHVSAVLLAPSRTAVENLEREGITAGVHLVGDVMSDVLLAAARIARERSHALDRLALEDGSYLLATVHRAENTDDAARLQAILDGLGDAGSPVVLPLHPRTCNAIAAAGCGLPGNIRRIEPVGYLDMVRLELGARAILTDSGGIQKEAYWLGVPCITLREETEWVETVEAGWNTLAGADRERIAAALRGLDVPAERPRLYGDGEVAPRCVAAIESGLRRRAAGARDA